MECRWIRFGVTLIAHIGVVLNPLLGMHYAWVGRGGIIVYECTSHPSNYLYTWPPYVCRRILSNDLNFFLFKVFNTTPVVKSTVKGNLWDAYYFNGSYVGWMRGTLLYNNFLLSLTSPPPLSTPKRGDYPLQKCTSHPSNIKKTRPLIRATSHTRLRAHDH